MSAYLRFRRRARLDRRLFLLPDTCLGLDIFVIDDGLLSNILIQEEASGRDYRPIWIWPNWPTVGINGRPHWPHPSITITVGHAIAGRTAVTLCERRER